MRGQGAVVVVLGAILGVAVDVDQITNELVAARADFDSAPDRDGRLEITVAEHPVASPALPLRDAGAPADSVLVPQPCGELVERIAELPI